MQLPVQITFRDMESSPAIEQAIRDKAAKLERHCGRIISCRVVVEAPHQHHHRGKLYRVGVDLKIPQGEFVASRNPADNHAHEDLYVAIRDAFNSVQRQLESQARRRRGEVKSHERPPQGRVAELFPEQDYGLIRAEDGRELYFHRNSLLGASFDKLEPGDEVRYVEEPGEQGPQASTVHLMGKS